MKMFTYILLAALIFGGGYYFISMSKRPQPQLQQQPPATVQAQNTVTLTADGFLPSTLTIKAGTTVTWINNSGSDATVNSDPHPLHTDYPPLNLGSFSDGQTLSLIFNTAGTHGYHNHFNSDQKGTIIVE